MKLTSIFGVSLRKKNFFQLILTYSVTETDVLNKNEKCDDVPNSNFESFTKRAKSLFVIAPTAPTENYKSFAQKVQEYNAKPPFNFETSEILISKNYEKVSKYFFKNIHITI